MSDQSESDSWFWLPKCWRRHKKWESGHPSVRSSQYHQSLYLQSATVACHSWQCMPQKPWGNHWHWITNHSVWKIAHWKLVGESGCVPSRSGLQPIGLQNQIGLSKCWHRDWQNKGTNPFRFPSEPLYQSFIKTYQSFIKTWDIRADRRCYVRWNLQVVHFKLWTSQSTLRSAENTISYNLVQSLQLEMLSSESPRSGLEDPKKMIATNQTRGKLNLPTTWQRTDEEARHPKILAKPQTQTLWKIFTENVFWQSFSVTCET